jgi:hypothetical protein
MAALLHHLLTVWKYSNITPGLKKERWRGSGALRSSGPLPPVAFPALVFLKQPVIVFFAGCHQCQT